MSTPTLIPPSLHHNAFVTDSRSTRILARAQAKQATQAAKVEHQARAALLELEQREAEFELTQRRKAAQQATKKRRKEHRRTRRRATLAQGRVLIARLMQWALLASPVGLPLVTAFIGQVQFARHELGWSLVGQVLYGAGMEILTVYAGWLAFEVRRAGDRGVAYQVATGVFALVNAAMQYWHYSDDLAPTSKAVAFATATIWGYIAWEMYAAHYHRQHKRALGQLPPPRPRIARDHCLRYPRVSLRARSLMIRSRSDYPTAEAALAAAWAEYDQRIVQRRQEKLFKQFGKQLHHLWRQGRISTPSPVEAKADQPAAIATLPSSTDMDQPAPPATRSGPGNVCQPVRSALGRTFTRKSTTKQRADVEPQLWQAALEIRSEIARDKARLNRKELRRRLQHRHLSLANDKAGPLLRALKATTK